MVENLICFTCNFIQRLSIPVYFRSWKLVWKNCWDYLYTTKGTIMFWSMFRLDEARDTCPAHIKTLKSGQEIRKPTKESITNKSFLKIIIGYFYHCIFFSELLIFATSLKEELWIERSGLHTGNDTEMLLKTSV